MTNDRTNHTGGLAERLIALVWRKPAGGIAERTRRRVVIHLIPFLFFLYILAYLDRVNVSVAQLSMEEPPLNSAVGAVGLLAAPHGPGPLLGYSAFEAGRAVPVGGTGLGFDRRIVGFGAGLFFLGYWILEIPSSISVARWGARWVFVRILILWGLCAALVGAIGTPFGSALFAWLPAIPEHAGWVGTMDGVLQTLFGWLVRWFSPSARLHLVASAVHFYNGLPHFATNQFYFFRFMLGFFEGGFFPSVIVYLSLWFRAEDRAKAIAGFMAAIPLSSMVGVPFSGLLLSVNWLGLPGWRWIFILEGVAPILAGFATIFFLPDRPSKAAWLPTDERDWLNDQLDKEHRAKKGQGHMAWVRHLGMVLLLTLVYLGLNTSSYGLSMFMPAIIKSQSRASSETASYLAALPYVMGLIAMLINGWHSDRTRERPWHVAVPLGFLSLGIFLTAALDGHGAWPVLVIILVVGTFMYAHLPAFWPIPTMFLGATAAASAIGFINMIGNLGGFVGPTLVGEAATGRASFAPALLILAPFPLISAAIVLVVGYFRRKYPVGADAIPATPLVPPPVKTAAASPPK